ncbi:MAG: hypothetical protein Q8L44_11645, partial [Sulfuritalea sp.]|nr:hypothetical protein [Sulfuritalea sp.]
MQSKPAPSFDVPSFRRLCMPWIPLRGVAKPESSSRQVSSPYRQRRLIGFPFEGRCRVSPRQATYFLVRARKSAKKRSLYGSQSLVTDRFKDMGNSYYPAWMSSGGDSHALEGCATNGR